jgi:hypothetical protein
MKVIHSDNVEWFWKPVHSTLKLLRSDTELAAPYLDGGICEMGVFGEFLELPSVELPS